MYAAARSVVVQFLSIVYPTEHALHAGCLEEYRLINALEVKRAMLNPRRYADNRWLGI